MVEEAAVEAAVARGVAVVSVMWVNNEVGTIQPVAALAERCRAAHVCFHSDAVQAFGKVPVSLSDVGCTLDRKSTRLNSSHGYISYAVFCLKKKNSYHI